MTQIEMGITFAYIIAKLTNNSGFDRNTFQSE